jgi:hypothetical protein
MNCELMLTYDTREIADRRPEILVSIYIFDIQYALVILPTKFWTKRFFGDKQEWPYSEESIYMYTALKKKN